MWLREHFEVIIRYLRSVYCHNRSKIRTEVRHYPTWDRWYEIPILSIISSISNVSYMILFYVHLVHYIREQFHFLKNIFLTFSRKKRSCKYSKKYSIDINIFNFALFFFNSKWNFKLKWIIICIFLNTLLGSFGLLCLFVSSAIFVRTLLD